MSSPILLGTILLEPHRWRADLVPLVRASEWVGRASVAGFDGIELWQRHYTDASPEEKAALENLPEPPAVFSTYISFQDTSEAAAQREEVAEAIRRTRASGVKFNLGTDSTKRAEYLRNFREWAATLPPGVELFNECHVGDIADKPRAARQIFDELALPDLGIIIHAFSIEPQGLNAWFEQFPTAIRHIHVQHRHDDGLWYRLERAVADNTAKCQLLHHHGFCGSLTIEFTETVEWGRQNPTSEKNSDALFTHACADLKFLRENL